MKNRIVALSLPLMLSAIAFPLQAQAQEAVVEPQPTASENAAAVAQDFIDSLSSQEYSAAIQTFDTTASTNVTQLSLAQTWQDIVAESGPLQSQMDVRTEALAEAEGSYLVIITGEFEGGTRDLFVIVNSDDEVVSLDAVEVE